MDINERYGIIKCSSVPIGAEIWIDETNTGFLTPWSTSVPNVQHKITFKYPGYLDCSVDVTVYPNHVVDAICDMQVQYITLKDIWKIISRVIRRTK